MYSAVGSVVTVAGNTVAVGRRTLREIRRRDIGFMAASLAFYAFVSLIPMLLLALVALSILWNEEVANSVVVAVSGVLTPDATMELIQTLAEAPGRSGATVASVAVLVWSTLRVFRALDTAFSRVYGAVHRPSLAEQLVDALTALVAIGVGVTGVVVVGAALDAVVGSVTRVVGQAALFLALTAVFLPLYYLFPDVEMTLPEALPGAVVAGGGWTVLQILFSIYANLAGGYALYGLLGAVLLVLTWLYVGGFLLLLGAVVNVTLAEHEGYVERRDVGPGPRAVRRTVGGRSDRQLQHERKRTVTEVGRMSDDTEPEPAPDLATLQSDVESVRRDVAEFERRVEERTVDRDDLDAELRRYVRWRVRRGHARGWGPYLVLLYGTAMSLGAFHYLRGGWAILAMLVVWLSTLGLYALMLVVGAGLGVVDAVGKGRDLVSRWRS